MAKNRITFHEVYDNYMFNTQRITSGWFSKPVLEEYIEHSNSEGGSNSGGGITTVAIIKVTPATKPLAERLRERGIQPS